VSGDESNQPFDASRSRTVIPSLSIKESSAGNSACSGVPPIVDKECKQGLDLANNC
jgi:hypothetical protein